VNTSFLQADTSGGSYSKGYSYGSLINGSGGSIGISADTLNVSDGGVRLYSRGEKGGSIGLDADELSTPVLMMNSAGTDGTVDIRSKNLTTEYLIVGVSGGGEDPSYGTVDIDTSNLTIRSFGTGAGFLPVGPGLYILANSSAYENTSSSISLNVSDTLLVEDGAAGIFMYANGKKAGNLSLNAGNISTPDLFLEATGVNEDGGGDGGEVNLKARNIQADYLRADVSGGKGRSGNPDGGNAGAINLDVQHNLTVNSSDGAGVFLYATGGDGRDGRSSSRDGGTGGDGGEIHATIGTLTGNLTADISGGDGGDGYSASGNPNGNGGDGGDSPQNSIDLVLGSATGTISATADGGTGGNAGTSGTGTAVAGDGGDGGRIAIDYGSLTGTVSTSVAGGDGGYDSAGAQTGTDGSAGAASVIEGDEPSGPDPGTPPSSGIDLSTPDDITDAFTLPVSYAKEELSSSAQDKINAKLKELEAMGWTIDYEKQLQVVIQDTRYHTCYARDPQKQEIWLAFNLDGDLLSKAGSTPGTISPALQASISQLSGFAYDKNHVDATAMQQAAEKVKTGLSEIGSGIGEQYNLEGEEALADYYDRIREATPDEPRAAGSRCPASYTPDQREAQLRSDYTKNTLLAVETMGKNRTQEASALNTGMTFAWQSTITTLSRNSVISMEANIGILNSHQTGGKIWSDKEMNYYQNHESASAIVPTDIKTLEAISGTTDLEATPLEDIGFGDARVKKLLPYIAEGKFTDETVNLSRGCYQATLNDERISSYVASTRENRNL
ncbi:MAG: hypothetical protein LUQ07_03975, partial [Methanospirillum sp.]|nr:hypothetical protein [Methanospirillum sp.]